MRGELRKRKSGPIYRPACSFWSAMSRESKRLRGWSAKDERFGERQKERFPWNFTSLLANAMAQYEFTAQSAIVPAT
jgi:hypothetical protein